MAKSPVMGEHPEVSGFPPLKASAHRQPAAEARRHPRYAFRGRARAIVYPPPSQPTRQPLESEVLTTDLSRSGLSLLHRRALVPGQRLRLLLLQAERLVEVCWCCRVWPGLYAAGCRFVSDEAPGA
jgi:hypothetical protein